MKASEVINIRLTWGEIQRICNILAECGNGGLVKPFDEAVKLHIERSEEEPDAYTRR